MDPVELHLLTGKVYEFEPDVLYISVVHSGWSFFKEKHAPLSQKLSPSFLVISPSLSPRLITSMPPDQLVWVLNPSVLSRLQILSVGP